MGQQIETPCCPNPPCLKGSNIFEECVRARKELSHHSQQTQKDQVGQISVSHCSGRIRIYRTAVKWCLNCQLMLSVNHNNQYCVYACAKVCCSMSESPSESIAEFIMSSYAETAKGKKQHAMGLCCLKAEAFHATKTIKNHRNPSLIHHCHCQFSDDHA